ncbi:MAG: glycosyltransferase family 4 protein [Candidatus Nanopelagicales bacterium]
MRVGIVAESFLPHVNGVSNSVLRILEHLQQRHHQGVVLAPASRSAPPPQSYAGSPIHAMASLPTPRYRQVRVSLATTRHITSLLAEHDVDVVHLASPFFTGLPAVRAASLFDVPVVASYQTDLAAFVTRYGFAPLAAPIWQRLRAIHSAAQLNLVPSRASMEQLRRQGIPHVRLLPRGVDAERFNPRHRCAALRQQWAPGGETVVGYVGRLAPEKCIDDLRVLHNTPGIRLVIVGDGPERARLERLLPGAAFLGFLQGQDLSRAVATFDIGVHTGPHETFCQSLQEVLASGVPAVAVGAGGPLDLVESSRNGWLYAPGDLDELRKRVIDLAGDVAKCRAMGRRAREGVETRTWESVGDQLIAHYRRLTGVADESLRTAA